MLILWVLLLHLVLARSTTGQQQNIPAQAGGSVTLAKGTFSETENVYVGWYFSATGKEEDYVLLIWRKPKDSPKTGNNDWQKRVSLTEDSALTISPVLEADFAGVFKCEQNNFRANTEAFYRLIDVQMPMNLLLLEGETLSLKCMLQNDVRWTAPNSTTISNRHFGSTKVLRVPNTSIQDSGVWACTGPNNFKATTAVTILGISPPPSETVYTSTSLFTPTTLPCSLSAAVQWPQLREKGLQGGSWSFTPQNESNQQDPTLLTLDLNNTQAWRTQKTPSCLAGRVLNNYDLSVQCSASTDCRGTYQCSLNFNSSRRLLSRKVKLEVLEVLSSAPVGVTLLEGDPVNLNCSLGFPLPSDLQVEWTPPKSSAIPQRKVVNLYLPAVSVKDSGEWKCKLMRNSTVLTSASVTLKIEKLVDTWVLVTIGSALIFILLLIIILFIIRRRRQVIITRRRTKFCCCKNPQPKGFYKY